MRFSQTLERLKPGETTAQVTEAAAAQFSRLAESLRSRGLPSERAARVLKKEQRRDLASAASAAVARVLLRNGITAKSSRPTLVFAFG